MTLDAERLGRLREGQLRATVREHFGVPDAATSPFPSGASAQDGTTGWVLVDGPAQRMLGRVLAWGLSREVEELHLLAADSAGDLARRAQFFRDGPVVWALEGTTPVRAQPAPRPDIEPPRGTAGLEALLVGAGLDVVVEHGVITGELRGLEVARVVHDTDGLRLEVGVGRFDREMGAMLTGSRTVQETLANAVAQVARHRRQGAPPHPLGNLVPERALRADLIADPSRVGAQHLVAVPTTVVRHNLRDPHPAAAVGTTTEGGPIVVVTSMGVDLDVVPLAADVRAGHDPAAKLVIAMRQRDIHPLTRRLAGMVRPQATVVAVED